MIPIAFFVNEKFNYPLSVCLTSIFENNNSKDLSIYIFINNLGLLSCKDSLKYIIRYYNANVTFIEIEDIYQKYPSICTSATYYRLQIPEVLKDRYDKVITLDADTSIECNLENLYNIDLEGNIIGAITDESPGLLEYSQKILQLKNPKYMNAGVLLVDINKWLNFNTTFKILKYIKENKYIVRYSEQDGIIKVLEDNIKWLPRQYNIFNNFKAPELLETNSTERIIHYTSIKPWVEDTPTNHCPKVFREIFNKYRQILERKELYEYSLLFR
jgi:lipopolysaccharide biosynthesis glycosyltransferase